MSETETRRRIDNCRDILVGKVPDPKSQVEQIAIALIYKFMGDINDVLGENWQWLIPEYVKDYVSLSIYIQRKENVYV